MAAAETHTEPEPTTYTWPKPNPEGGHMFIHPNYLNHQLRAQPHDYVKDFVREALRTYLVQLTTKNIDFDTARRLAKGTHRIEIDEDSDETNYLITIVPND